MMEKMKSLGRTEIIKYGLTAAIVVYVAVLLSLQRKYKKF